MNMIYYKDYTIKLDEQKVSYDKVYSTNAPAQGEYGKIEVSQTRVKKTGAVEEYNKEKTEMKAVYDEVFTFDVEASTYFVLPDGTAHAFDYSKDADYYKHTEPQSVLYMWMFGFGQDVIYGRSIEEMREWFAVLRSEYTAQMQSIIDAKSDNKKKTGNTHCTGPAMPIIYVHNLAYDFVFLQEALGDKWDVFARSPRKPMYARNTKYHVEFKCSYILTNKSLDQCIKDCDIVPDGIAKQVGSLDYNKIRTPLTPLTSEEMKYCEMDIRGLYWVITENKMQYHHVHKIPLTATGKVRKEMKKVIYKDREYRDRLKRQTPDFNELNILMKAYSGGYTHANARHANKILDNVMSLDFTSSYPAVLCLEKYPTGRMVRREQDTLEGIDWANECVIADITFSNIECTGDNTYLSISKAQKYDPAGEEIGYEKAIKRDNGRVIKAERVRYVLTDVDMLSVMNNYKWKDMKVNAVYTSKKDYLPKCVIEYLLELFFRKTAYKGVAGKESMYKQSKESINAIYGMCVTKVLADEVQLSRGEWKVVKLEEDQAELKLQKLEESEGQIVTFSTGVWCAAYARRHLWEIIEKIGKDVVYCDTDSVKFLNPDKHMHVFEEDSDKIDRQVFEVCMARNLDPALFKPKSPDGVEQHLGKAEVDGIYTQFRTLGAKKYAYIEADVIKDKKCDGCIHAENCGKKTCRKVEITVSGVNKRTGMSRFMTLEDFEADTKLDYHQAGKGLMIYRDDMMDYTFEDGFTATYRKGACFQPTTYHLDLSGDYHALLSYINGVRTQGQYVGSIGCSLFD